MAESDNIVRLAELQDPHAVAPHSAFSARSAKPLAVLANALAQCAR